MLKKYQNQSTNNIILGFVLVELLAVIVILVIIALIATPIVLNIIEDSKASSKLNSANNYVDAVEYSIANEFLNDRNVLDGTYKIMKNGNICLKVLNNDTCSDEIIIDVSGEVPDAGKIKLEGKKITDIVLKYQDKYIEKNSQGDLVYAEPPTCVLTENGDIDKNGTITAGDKYLCKVDPDEVAYTFYVLTTPLDTDETIDLIMNQNINSDGSVDKGVYDLVAWYGVDQDNSFGPVTAMEFLYNATKSWTNVPNLNYEYNDKEFHGGSNGYISFISTDGVAVITPASGDIATLGTKDVPLRSRMPIYTNVAANASKSEVTAKTDNNLYLYDNLDPEGDYAPYGYWTLSSYSDMYAWYVRYDGTIIAHNYFGFVAHKSGVGVRPVITIPEIDIL